MASSDVLSFKNAMLAKASSLYSGARLASKTKIIDDACSYLGEKDADNAVTFGSGIIDFDNRPSMSLFVRGLGDILNVSSVQLRVSIKE